MAVAIGQHRSDFKLRFCGATSHAGESDSTPMGTWPSAGPRAHHRSAGRQTTRLPLPGKRFGDLCGRRATRKTWSPRSPSLGIATTRGCSCISSTGTWGALTESRTDIYGGQRAHGIGAYGPCPTRAPSLSPSRDHFPIKFQTPTDMFGSSRHYIRSISTTWISGWVGSNVPVTFTLRPLNFPAFSWLSRKKL